MVFGSYNHQLDAKNRFRIPSKFKQSLGEDLVITKGTNNCLFLFSSEELNNSVISKMDSISLFDSNAQKSLRLLMSSSFELETDNQGRTLLPQILKDYANINKDIVLIGVGKRVEIWSAENWKAYNDGVDFDAETEKLKDYGV